MGRSHTPAALMLVAAVLSVFPGAGSVAWAQTPDDPLTAHVSEAVQSLFSLDQERVSEAARRLEEQDVIRQEITVCIDPAERTLTAESRLWVESNSTRISLMLDGGLEVLSVVDSRGDSLEYNREGRVLAVMAREGATSFPLEIEVSYEGRLEPGPDVWLSSDGVALGPRFNWYPVSEGRDPARLRVEARYPTGYSSVVSGTLAGMAPSLAGHGVCTEGDVWEVPTPVDGASVIVGALESSLSVVGDVFFGHHQLFEEVSDATDESEWRGGPGSVPEELIELLRFLESCFGPYPYEWINIVEFPGSSGHPLEAMEAPGLVVVRGGLRTRNAGGIPLGKVVSGLSHSWWTFWVDPGPVVSESIATTTEAAWLTAVGDDDGAALVRGVARSRFMEAVRVSGGHVSLRDCLGENGTVEAGACIGKGAAVLEMLETVVGEHTYCSALRRVLSEHGGMPVGVGSLADAFEEEYGSDLDWFFYEWMARDDLPSYVVDYETLRQPGGSYLVSGVVLQEGESYRTPLPISIDLGGWSYDETISIESSHQRFEILTDAEPMLVTVDEGELIPKLNRAELARARYGSGTQAARSGDWGTAVDELGAASALEPSNVTYVLDYARALVRYGLLDAGLDAMDMAVKLDTENVDLLMEAADLRLRTGGFTEALELLDAHGALLPDSAAGQVRKGRALVELGRLDEAEVAIEGAREAARAAGSSMSITEELLLASGRLLERRGDSAAAVRAYEAAIAVNPVSDEARRLLRGMSLPTPE